MFQVDVLKQVLVQNTLQFKGKSLSEALILAATNPQYDKRLFIELRVQYMEKLQAKNMLCTQIVVFLFLYWQFRTIYVHNMF